MNAYIYPCSVCGCKEYASNKVLWPELFTDWQLSIYENQYIDRQQGEVCMSCGANLRSIALADAIRSCFGQCGFLMQLIESEKGSEISILEINEAGMLSPHLKLFKKIQICCIPSF